MMKAPKITAMSICWVMYADEQHADEDRDDPPTGNRPASSKATVARASSRRTTSTITSVNATAECDRAQHGAHAPARATAVASAIRNHAVTSSIAAAASASVPTGVFSMRRSATIRASTGNAVIDIATPMNSANATNVVCGANRW